MTIMGTNNTFAKVYYDHEAHPIPLVDVSIVLPIGFETKNPEDSGAANLLSDMLENGTATLDRQAFLDKLASYGASTSFSVSNQYSYIRFSFPLLKDKNYDELIRVFAENWQKPRWTQDNFKLAVLKMESALTGALDSDMSLGISTARRWVNKKEFGGNPLFIDKLKKLTIDRVKAVHEKNFLTVPEMWVGVVGPTESAPLVKKMLAAMFPQQGEVIEGQRLEKMKVLAPADASKAKASKTILVVDKPGRNQTVTSVTAINPHDLPDDEDLAFQFGNHILVDSGLGSLFGDEIRNKRGLAYSVSGVSSQYLGFPVLGFAANPVRDRTDEAFGVFANLMKTSFETGTVFSEIPQDTWDRQWNSFTYSRILERSTPMGRLGERMSIITGGQSADLYKKPVSEWKVSKKDIEKLFSDHWKKSIITMSFVGEAKELKPLVEKHFPAYAVKVLSYKDTIKSSTYE